MPRGPASNLTIAEIEWILTSDLSDVEAAQHLGRNRMSVYNTRILKTNIAAHVAARLGIKRAKSTRRAERWLTPKQVEMVLTSKLPPREIARWLGVTASHVWRVRVLKTKMAVQVAERLDAEGIERYRAQASGQESNLNGQRRGGRPRL